MTEFTKAIDILNNKDAYIGHIVCMKTPFAGSQWVVLKDVELNEDGSIKFTFKMICHNAHLGIRSLTVLADEVILNQRIGDFIKWCNMYDIEMNLEEK